MTFPTTARAGRASRQHLVATILTTTAWIRSYLDARLNLLGLARRLQLPLSTTLDTRLHRIAIPIEPLKPEGTRLETDDIVRRIILQRVMVFAQLGYIERLS